ncbi:MULTISPECIES: polymorphic toxin-type HINT domain-containing protein, partial [unclassified Micromonospora]|uniref:polymorphic toxin-type HINT domain-containing protein n=1 Tax=unclassified Micromonospora TaxID=2617518 RepID=UPI003A83B46B
TATITGDGVKHLVTITIDTDSQHDDKGGYPDTTNGHSDPGVAQITATDGHPFWVPELDEWIDATHLQPGQWLHTSSGTWIQITAIHRRTVPHATVHNLTISHVHTYHVIAGNTPVLVHNCGDAAKHSVDNLADSLDDNVVFHYTSEGSHAKIMDGGVVTANAKGVTYFTREMLSSKETSNALFMGRGGDRGTHLIALRLPAGTKLVPGSQPNELMYTGSFRFTLDDVVFHGPNPFG